MKTFSFALVLLLGPLTAKMDAIDLTPHPFTTTYGNVRVTRYFFQDADKQMAFRIDNNMVVKGGSGAAVFKFQDIRNAELQIRKSSASPEMLFSGKELEAYRTSARALLPENAADIQLETENENAIPINGWSSYQFVFAYKVFGFVYRRTITFLNYNKLEQLVIDVSAPASDFGKVSLRSYQVINSLSEFRSSSSGST